MPDTPFPSLPSPRGVYTNQLLTHPLKAKTTPSLPPYPPYLLYPPTISPSQTNDRNPISEKQGKREEHGKKKVRGKDNKLHIPAGPQACAGTLLF